MADRELGGWSPEALRREVDHVERVSIEHENAVVADHWAGFQVRRRLEQRPEPRARSATTRTGR